VNWVAVAIGGALLLGALSTLYDLIWALWIPRHRAVYGLVHGMTLLSAVGGVLGWRVGRLGAGLAGGALAGLIAAGSFYVFYGGLGYLGAMVAAWMLLWLLFAMLDSRLSGRRTLSGEMVARGLAAAVLSGVAFWLISGIWTAHPPGGPNYAWNFACWTFAFLPGFAALLMPRRAVEA
jgi:hypothetical protein